jgi:hypothetical protein
MVNFVNILVYYHSNLLHHSFFKYKTDQLVIFDQHDNIVQMYITKMDLNEKLRKDVL